jgi:DNA-binding NtrC family response regulator
MQQLLLIDDDNPLVPLFKRHLDVSGYAVTVACDSLSALEAVKKKSFAAVIADICMPGTGEQDLLAQLRWVCPDLPAIVVSGYTRNFIWDMDHQTKLVSKPVDLNQMVQFLNEMTSRRKAVRRVA